MKNPFNENATNYDSWYDENPDVYSAELDIIRQALGDISGQQWLEVGVGSGRFASQLGFTHGIDPGADLLEIANSRAITTSQGYAENLPFRDESFDGVGIFTALEFFSDQTAGLKEVHRVLRSNAHLVVAFLNLASEAGKKLEMSKRDDPYYRNAKFFTPEKLTDLLTKTGFTPIYKTQLSPANLQVSLGNTSELYCVVKAVRS